MVERLVNITDNALGYIIDDDGAGRMILAGNVYTSIFRKDWATGQSIFAFFDIKADHSGITVWGEAKDKNSAIIKTEIVHVLPSGAFVSLGQSQNSRCEVIWPRESMTDGVANEIMFFLTNSTGARYGASTRISKPTP